jgi:hypothetical protein
MKLEIANETEFIYCYNSKSYIYEKHIKGVGSM